ncbi:hypothetical protein COEREDRAFT_8966 [Coemansia reversa NRRL 1564]|uniref:Uncharacterized protein n=1 Tax=Coemansia reversa (strain ATCC 12441 / NRRL 1564) TaxID=763665 RepID=A0A2G5B9Q5_COERN|nr:hypothetical protein COEREDRAFT_8966 [Coemansia reversa NRRL 1564]|eukprot:PIA15741.1 hypothetical protein COEREDRAFT_8966 [Coemansia reversa NRRL 1564]
MPESNPSLPDSNINMEINNNAYAAYTLDQLLGVLRQIVAVLPPDRICEILPASPAVPDAATSKAAYNGTRGKISCETFTSQATKFSAMDLHMSAQSWIAINKRDLAEFYDFLCDSFPQADYELRVQDAARSGKLFMQAPKHAMSTFALAIYKNINQENPLSTTLIAHTLFAVNSLPFVVYKIVPDAIHPDKVPEMCCCFNHANKIRLTLGNGNNATTPPAGSGKKKKKRRAEPTIPHPRLLTCQHRPYQALQAPRARKVSHLMAIPGLHAKNCELRALADTGAKVDDGPRIWTNMVIVSFGKGWDLLVGGKTLQQLGVQLTLPVMDRCLGAASKAADHPAKTLDGPSMALAVAQIIESTYESIPDTEPSRELSHLSPTETSSAAAPVSEPVVSPNYFVPERDDEFVMLNALYPEATEASINEHLHHQCATDLHAEALLGELLMGKDAVWEYPGRCPLPAAFAPIQPPMHGEAKPVYMVQHTLSNAARAARDEVVSMCLQYEIDEPLQDFMQLPIFTKAKPNTTERWVLFDDSANNSLNMISIGMQLPTPMERALFLHDTHIISSVDMASFFMQLRLSADIADY